MVKLLKTEVVVIALFALSANSLAQSVNPGWVSQVSGTANFLECVFFTSANTGIVVGGRGTILHTTNSGEKWVGQVSGTTYDLYAVFFADSNTGTAVGDGGTILRTTNGGTVWERQQSGTNTLLRAVSFINPNTGIAVGGTRTIGDTGTILHTTNGGSTWIRQISGTVEGLYAVYLTDANICTVGGWNGTILHTTNAGVSWIIQESPVSDGIIYVKFFDTNTGVAVGYSGPTLHTTDGGATWVSRAFGIGPVFGAFFTNASTGFIAGTYVDATEGMIFATTNGGANWDRNFVIQDWYFRSIWFVNSDTGFAVGDSGTIFRTTTGGRKTSVSNDQFPTMPSTFVLGQGYPNPFAVSTNIPYHLTHSGDITLRVFDLLGRDIATLHHGLADAGFHEVRFYADDLPTGMYTVQAKTAQGFAVINVLLIR